MADTAKTLNFVGKAPTALAHANFTTLCRRASPTCPDHPQPVAASQASPRPVPARDSSAYQTTSVAFHRYERAPLLSPVRPSGKEGKPFKCSAGRRTMHLRPHSLSVAPIPTFTSSRRDILFVLGVMAPCAFDVVYFNEGWKKRYNFVIKSILLKHLCATKNTQKYR